MNKLAELKAAAEAVDVPMYLPERTRDDIQSLQQAWILYHNLANPATILKLIAVVNSLREMVTDKEDGPFFHDDEHPEGSTYRRAKNLLKELNDD
jgi:hypothetical protein